MRMIIKRYLKIGSLLFLFICFLCCWYMLLRNSVKHDVPLGLYTNEKIDITPTEIRSIENIGQWEFLAVSDEELVDSIKTGFFSDDELVRIYYGTMRLGIDLKKAQKDWIKVDGDTIDVCLPQITLLDERFIDEARTRSFFEKGTWTAADREAFYQKAYQLMRKRGMSKKNIEIAQANARQQFEQFMKSMGYQKVRVHF